MAATGPWCSWSSIMGSAHFSPTPGLLPRLAPRHSMDFLRRPVTDLFAVSGGLPEGNHLPNPTPLQGLAHGRCSRQLLQDRLKWKVNSKRALTRVTSLELGVMHWRQENQTVQKQSPEQAEARMPSKEPGETTYSYTVGGTKEL